MKGLWGAGMRLSISLVGLALLVVCLSACGPDEPNDNEGFNLPTATPPFTASPSPTQSPPPQGTPTRVGVHQAVVRIRGTSGATFRGQLSDGSSNQSIDGTIPAEFSLVNARSFVSASANVTSAGRNELTVQILVDGLLRDERTAFSEFASVSLTVSVD